MSAGSGIRKKVWAVWLVLAALIVVIFVVESRRKNEIPREIAESVHGIAGSRMLLPVPAPALVAVELGYRGVMHRFDRDAAGAWLYHGVHQGPQSEHAHQSDPAKAEMIDKAFAALARTRMEREFDLDLKAQSYGLTAPQMVILVYGKDNPLPLGQYAVGDVAPDGFSRYILKVGGAKVITIANFQIENLIGLLDRLGQPVPAPGSKR